MSKKRFVSHQEKIALSPRDEQRISKTMDLFDGVGPVLKGTYLSHDGAIQEALRRNPAKPYCLVGGWVLVELDLTDEQRRHIEVDGFKAFIVHANYIISDSACRFQPGHWVRTSPQLRYEEDGFFETRSTTYVLMGDGCYQKLKPEIVYGLV